MLVWMSLLILAYFNVPFAHAAPAQLPNASRAFVELLNTARCPARKSRADIHFLTEPQLLTNRQTGSSGCQHVAECNVYSNLAEVNVLWSVNSKLVDLSTMHDVVLDQPEDSTLSIGMTDSRHRICLDAFLKPGLMNGVKCRVESPCALESTQESPVMLLNMKHSWSYGNRPSELQIAPLITMTTTMRMEDAGKMIQFFCRASGSEPQITWSVMDAEDEHKFHSLAAYPFVSVMDDGSAVIDTSKTDDVSITLQCRAHNEAGEDVALSTMIVTDETSDMNDEEEEWEERK